MQLSRNQRRRLHNVVREYQSAFLDRFKRLTSSVLENYVPTKAREHALEFDPLIAALHVAWTEELRSEDQPDTSDVESGPFPDAFAPLLREALIWVRLRLANGIEERKGLTIHPEILELLDAELRPFDALLNAQWCEQAATRPIPQLTEFFPIERVELEAAKAGDTGLLRSYDEKFHILQAPSLFLGDLNRARETATLRGISLAVAYLDIDDFKAFNTEHGEPMVDRQVLPAFMRTIEAHVYTRGHAYRYGGDEYVVLLNNVTEAEALGSMERLRELLGALNYEGVEQHTTVSVGVVLVGPDCHLTGHEIEKAAATAKNFAKKSGRDRLATYKGRFFRAEDLRVASSGEFTT